MDAITKNGFVREILCMLFLFTCGCRDNSDFDNLARIKKGMTIVEVNSIMGAPDSSFIDPSDTLQLKYQYNASFGMSGDMCVYFSLPDSSVQYIYDGR